MSTNTFHLNQLIPMAEIQPSAPAAKDGKPRARKVGFHLDMAPMVDLAFLLLTFFMLTTTFSKPTVMTLNMPEPDIRNTAVPESRALTLILGKHNQVHYFFGVNDASSHPALHTTTFAAEGLRQVLLDRQRQQPGSVVLIKSSDEANYQNLVDALDEMSITNQKKYALVNLDRTDRELLKKNGL
ncbi:biopolymer transporter ExbD [Hymenobacter sp. GOD-10R]|uniref:ExbD/TolR family protein n=1 Tax=Hymenobacter sp. GOD-10R TaxID=3093922 RepID=UPI002D797FB9|nr:biopolymer transporter ExbD [Hymenobacter sp. GOD-10R]WRQ28869.1 biopolymer transporter ExbD [Hymenobacter sp. GOD-10R]